MLFFSLINESWLRKKYLFLCKANETIFLSNEVEYVRSCDHTGMESGGEGWRGRWLDVDVSRIYSGETTVC